MRLFFKFSRFIILILRKYLRIFLFVLNLGLIFHKYTIEILTIEMRLKIF
jgi:hypothetical protein